MVFFHLTGTKLLQPLAEALFSVLIIPISVKNFNNNKKLKAQAVKLATQSKENEQFYQHKHIGYNYRISNVLAGIGRGQLKSLNAKLLALKANHLFYKQLFRSSVNIELVSKFNPNIQPNYWLNYIRVRKESKLTNFEILKHLEARGIQARPIWKPMHLQPLFENNKFYGNHVTFRI